jgi:hypothetical protein
MAALYRPEVPESEAVVQFLSGHQVLFDYHNIQKAQTEPCYPLFTPLPRLWVITSIATDLHNLSEFPSLWLQTWRWRENIPSKCSYPRKISPNKRLKYNRYSYIAVLRLSFLLRIYKSGCRVTYRMPQEEKSMFWEVIVSVFLSRNVCIYMCPIPNGFRDRAISLYTSKTVYRKEILRTVLIPVFIDQVTKLVQFTQHYVFSKILPSTFVHLATGVRRAYQHIRHLWICVGIYHNTPTISLSTVTTKNWRFTPTHMREGKTILGAKSKLLCSYSVKATNCGHYSCSRFSKYPRTSATSF